MAGASSEVIPDSNPIIKCPWGRKPAEPTTVSFEEVMSEELAKDLQIKENAVYLSTEGSSIVGDSEALLHMEAPDCNSDSLLAQYLQMEYDKEHDQQLSLEEAKFNGNSKVSVSYSNYRRSGDGKEESLDEECDNEKRDWDLFETSQKDSPTIPKCGYSKAGGVITTKHDGELTARRNACRVMEFPPGIHTGDGGGFDMQLNNSAFNQLKVHARSEKKRQTRLHDKIEKSTTMQTLDPKTMLILRKILDNGVLESINGPVAAGKESVVFHATGGKMEEEEEQTKPIPEECAIKIFKTTLNEFKNRDKYIADDHRFRDRLSKQNPRKVIHMWAEKEMRNLSRMRAASIPCPDVVFLKKHVLVMSFIGKEGKAAPRLKEAQLSKAEWIIAYESMLELTKRLFWDCRLVHADLSEFNILWHENQCWIIDVSQAVDYNHPTALEFLYRDCSNLCRFFEKQDVPKVKSVKEMFMFVSGIDIKGDGEEVIGELQNYSRGSSEQLGVGLGTNFTFDYAWSHSKETATHKQTTEI